MTPSVEVIIKIADVLEVSIDYLVGKTNLKIDNEIRYLLFKNYLIKKKNI
jgi:transcriptional regulator with XRE-family HTH domain